MFKWIEKLFPKTYPELEKPKSIPVFRAGTWLCVKLDFLQYHKSFSNTGDFCYLDVFAKPLSDVFYVNGNDCRLMSIDASGKLVVLSSRPRSINLYRYEEVKVDKLIKLLECELDRQKAKEEQDEIKRKKESSDVYKNVLLKNKCK